MLMSFVLAASRPWYRGMAERLAGATGQEFHFIAEKDRFTREVLDELAPELVFVPHWSHIIPAAVFENFECVMFHMTDLPYGRGGSPLQNLISRGHTETRLTAFRCTAELDAGPIYHQMPLGLEGTAQQIYERSTELVEQMIAHIVATRPEPRPQQGEPVLFKRRTPDMSDLSGLHDPGQIYDHIRMLDAEGYPRAFLQSGRLRLEFSDASLDDEGVTARVRIVPRDTKEGAE
jgi:methionyl-tRNA formyltransferase